MGKHMGKHVEYVVQSQIHRDYGFFYWTDCGRFGTIKEARDEVKSQEAHNRKTRIIKELTTWSKEVVK